jgi:hypothetical protein
VEDGQDFRQRREEFVRRNLRLSLVVAGALVAIALVLAAVGFRLAVGRTLLGVGLGLAIVLGFRLFRTQPHRGTGPTSWMVPASAIAGVIVLASLPPEWEPVAWGIFSGGLLAMAAGILQVRRRLVHDNELYLRAEREAREPEAS